MNVEESENVHGGYGKTVSHVIVGLKTTKGTKMLKLDPSIYENIQKERVTIGDVIYIEVNSGAIKVCVIWIFFYFFFLFCTHFEHDIMSLKRVGRCDIYSTEHDLEAEEYVPLPKGDVHKRKDIIQDVTLHDLDAANAKPQVFIYLFIYLFIFFVRRNE